MRYRFQGPVDDDPSRVLSNTNNLLSIVGISTKKVTSMGELTRVASSMFVAVFESLFHVRLEGIIRNPQNGEEYAHNAQQVIDSLSGRIQMDLQHITGDLIVRGDISALSNLVHIFVRIVSMTSQESHGMDIYLNGRQGSSSSDESEAESDSISTHESTFQQPHSGTRSQSILQRGGDDDRSESFAGSDEYKNVMELEARELFRSSQNSLFQEERMEAAKKRRLAMQRLRETNAITANRRRLDISNRAAQKRWTEELARDSDAFEVRRQSEENVMLRKMYRGLLSKMHEWSAEERSDTRRKVEGMRDEAKWHIQSMHNIFEDRVRMLKEQTLPSDDSALRNLYQLGSELRASFNEQRQKALMEQKNIIAQKRQHQLERRHESYKDLLSLLSVEKWDEGLRNYGSNSNTVHTHVSRSGIIPLGNKRNQRPRSAPPSRRSSSASPMNLSR